VDCWTSKSPAHGGEPGLPFNVYDKVPGVPEKNKTTYEADVGVELAVLNARLGFSGPLV
jgi:hypothetical protein